jgi:hypothetical protein
MCTLTNWPGNPLFGLLDLVARKENGLFLIVVKTEKASLLPLKRVL